MFLVQNYMFLVQNKNETFLEIDVFDQNIYLIKYSCMFTIKYIVDIWC